MLHKQTETQVNAWGLTQVQMDTVLDLQRVLGGSGAAFDYAYDIVTGGLPLGTHNEQTRYELKVEGIEEPILVNEAELVSYTLIPPGLLQSDYLQQRWNV